MPHLDEGIVHEYLDDELDLSQRREVDSHLRGCAQCRQLLEEAKGFMTEADRLVGAIELPLGPVRTMAAASMPETRKPGLVEAGSASIERRNPPQLRWIAWAATVVLAVGLGYVSNEVRHSPRAPVAETDKAEAASPPGVALDRQTAESSATPSRATQPSASNQAAPRERANEGERRVAGALAEEAKPQRSGASTGGASAAARPESSPQRRDEFAASDAVIAPAPPASLSAAKIARAQSVLETTRKDNAFRPVALEDAVRLLGGTVRLIDGMTAKRVLAGPAEGQGSQLIRVVYEDPPGRELWLDQQRHQTEAENTLQASTESGAPVLLPGDTLVAPGPPPRPRSNGSTKACSGLHLRATYPAIRSWRWYGACGENDPPGPASLGQARAERVDCTAVDLTEVNLKYVAPRSPRTRHATRRFGFRR